MCLDMLRAMERNPQGLESLLAELEDASSQQQALQNAVSSLRGALSLHGAERESQARHIAQNLIIAIQGSLLLRHAPNFVAEAFIRNRSDPAAGRVFGSMPATTVQQAILERAWPG
jgi:putative acyl-CoA dehydrogenase